MKSSTSIGVVCLTILLFTYVPSFAYAQNDPQATFVTSDGAFRLRYPEDWTIHEDEKGSLFLGNDNLSIGVLPPNAANDLDFISPRNKTALAVMKQFMTDSSKQFKFEEPTAITLDSGIHVVRSNIAQDDKIKGATAAFALVVEVEDTYAIVLALTLGGTSEELDSAVYSLIETFEIAPFEIADETPTLHDYYNDIIENTWPPAINELEDLELIPTGGELVYDEPFLTSAFNRGINLNDTASNYQDFVMAGLISFRAVDKELAICGLLTRVTQTSDDELGDFLLVGITSENHILVVEQLAVSTEPRVLEIDAPTDFYNPHHVLLSAQDNQLIVFIDGAPVIDWPLTAPDRTIELQDSGLHSGANLDPGCVMTSVWAYGLPSESTVTQNLNGL